MEEERSYQNTDGLGLWFMVKKPLNMSAVKEGLMGLMFTPQESYYFAALL